jgi:hypothetical protein
MGERRRITYITTRVRVLYNVHAKHYIPWRHDTVVYTYILILYSTVQYSTVL